MTDDASATWPHILAYADFFNEGLRITMYGSLIRASARGRIMRAPEFSVVEPLLLCSARRFGSHVRLVARDHRRRVIWFHFASESDAETHGVRFAAWIAERTHLAFVRGPIDSALLDVRSLLAR